VSSATLDTVLGKTLISIDGSAVSLTAREGTLTRQTIAANGAIRTTSFHFITDQLGTVSDERDPNKPLGVFRMDKREVAIQYADGGYETMFASAEGGLLVESRAPQQSAVCSAWYPVSHIFSLDERKSALAQYASRLGLDDSGNKEGTARKTDPACSTPHGLIATAEMAKAPLAPAAGESTLAVALGLSGSTALSSAAAASSALAVANAAPEGGKAGLPGPVSLVPQIGNRANSVDSAQRQRADSGIARGSEGASKCLSLESERGYRGFRNYCAYPVQFAYCVIGRTLQPASCQYGTVQGSTEAWGFTAFEDLPFSTANMAIGVRWIGCRGRASDVLPRLEQIDPPSGHCLAVSR
jgi:hypothetical protein